jgi:hypothetical protein
MRFFHATLSKRGEDLNPYICLKACFDIFMVYDILKQQFDASQLADPDENEYTDDVRGADVIEHMEAYLDAGNP